MTKLLIWTNQTPKSVVHDFHTRTFSHFRGISLDSCRSLTVGQNQVGEIPLPILFLFPAHNKNGIIFYSLRIELVKCHISFTPPPSHRYFTQARPGFIGVKWSELVQKVRSSYKTVMTDNISCSTHSSFEEN